MLLSQATQIVAYPGPTLTKLTDKPDHISYKIHIIELAASLGDHSTHLGGGNHGYIGAMTHGESDLNDLYNSLTSNAPAFVPPTHPGANPTIAANATQVATQQKIRAHQQKLAEHADYTGHIKAAKTNLIKAVGEDYFHSLKDDKTAFLNVSLAKLINHYRKEFATPDDEDLELNDITFKLPHNPTLTIEQTIAAKKRCQTFASGTDNEISNKKLIFQIKRAFYNTEIKEYQDAVDAFNKYTPADQTMAKLESDLRKAEKKYKQNNKGNMSVQQAGYNEANAATVNSIFADILAKPDKWHELPYCFTHGFNPHQPWHNSRTCRNKCNGHKDDATLFNMMGGNNWVKRQANEEVQPGWKQALARRNRNNNKKTSDKEN